MMMMMRTTTTMVNGRRKPVAVVVVALVVVGIWLVVSLEFAGYYQMPMPTTCQHRGRQEVIP
jgi:hypothetical protein